MKRIVMAMLCLVLVGSVEAGGKISFPLSEAEAVQFCNAFGKLVGRYQGYLAAGEAREDATRHFIVLFNNVDESVAKVLLSNYMLTASAIGMKDGATPALHRIVAEAVCIMYNRGLSAAVAVLKEERDKCEQEKRDIADGWDM